MPFRRVAAVLNLTALAATPSVADAQGVLRSLYELFYPKSWTCGDAAITDRGPLAAYGRLSVEIANVNLGADGDYVYSLCQLPRENLVFGLAVPVSERQAEQRDTVQSVKSETGTIDVGLVILDERERVVASHAGRFADEWIWEYGSSSLDAFVYALSLFLTPDRAESYTLRLSVRPADNAAPVAARLMASGGGWK